MSEMITDVDFLPGNRLKLKVRPCPTCGKTHEVVVGEYDYENWVDGVEGIEAAFPYLSAAERELLLTAIDGDCFAKMPTEDDEERPHEEGG
jgi:hypothetical protein